MVPSNDHGQNRRLRLARVVPAARAKVSHPNSMSAQRRARPTYLVKLLSCLYLSGTAMHWRSRRLRTAWKLPQVDGVAVLLLERGNLGIYGVGLADLRMCAGCQALGRVG